MASPLSALQEGKSPLALSCQPVVLPVQGLRAATGLHSVIPEEHQVPTVFPAENFATLGEKKNQNQLYFNACSNYLLFFYIISNISLRHNFLSFS